MAAVNDENNPVGMEEQEPSKPVSALQFKSIGIQGHSVGVCVFTSDELYWNSKNGEVHKRIEWSKTQAATWAFFGRYGHLRLFPKDGGNPMRLDGFAKTEYAALREFVTGRGVEFAKERVSCSGGNYGEISLGENNLLHFRDDEDRELFSISMRDISQCVLPGNNRKGNDVELQFHESDAVDQAEDALVEMRLCLPQDDTDDGTSTAEAFQQQVMSKANIHDVKGNVLVEFDRDQGTFLTPRGRYTIEMYGAFMRMHGSKYDYKIQYEDVNRLYLLEKPDDRYYAFVISLDKPIRQGQQRYQHLVLQTTNEEKEVRVHMKEEELADKYEGLMPVMSGPMSNLIAKCFKALSKRPVYVTGKFRSASGSKSVSCALGANDGHLYPLNKSFIFIHKPTRVIGFDEIESVEFQRYGGAQGTGATRNFDLCVTLSSVGSEATKDVIFSGIDRSEFITLNSFLSTKKIKLRAVRPEAMGSGILNMDDVLGEEHDPYKEVVAAEAANGDADSESEGDDDYAPKAGSGNDESSGDDSGSDVSGAEGATPKKKAKAKPAKASSSPAGGSSGGSDDDEGDSPPKAKPTKKRKKAVDAAEGGSTPKKAKGAKGKAKGGGEEKEKGGKAGAKKPRKKKDKDAPKGASSAFMQFSKAERPNVVAEHPDWRVPDVGRELGLRWKALPADARKPFEELAAKDKARYKSEMAAYNEKKRADSFASAVIAVEDDDDGGNDSPVQSD